jgi:tetratricopeptide (TPR) repeat protein
MMSIARALAALLIAAAPLAAAAQSPTPEIAPGQPFAQGQPLAPDRLPLDRGGPERETPPNAAPADPPAQPPALPPDLRAALDGAPEAPERTRASRAEKLDALLAQLADEKAADPRALQREIAELWAESGSDAMDLLLYRGREAIDAETYDKALEHLSALVELAPDFAEGWNARATVNFLRDEYWDAVADIQRALALEPRHFGALMGLASMLERTGDEKGALTAMREALRVNPHLEGGKEMVDRLAPGVDGRDI